MNILLLLAFLCFFYSCFRSYKPLYRAIDGDTFEVLKTGERIRIRGVDTPELKSKKDSKLAHSAKKKLQKFLDNGVSVVRTGKESYGRSIADVFSKGSNIAVQLVEEGFGKTMDIDLRVSEKKVFEHAEKKARSRRVGVWTHF